MAVAVVQWERMRPKPGTGRVGGEVSEIETTGLAVICEREGGVKNVFRVLLLSNREDGGTIK